MIVDALMWPVRWVMWAVFRVLLAQRYWLTLKGRDEVLEHPGPYLIMPNHPALVEPLLLYVRLWARFQVRPLVLETNFNNPVMAPFGFIMRAIRVPEIARASAQEKQRAEAAVAEVVATLNRGESVILWPSGRLSRDGSERLGGARTAADVLAAVPNVTVVLARTRGIWGSRFSFADREPHVLPSLFSGLALWASNLFVFAPRRRATTTLEAFGPHQRPAPTREAVNKWLEAWYNADVPREEPTFVPHHFLFGPRAHEFPPPPAPKEFDLSKVKPETKDAVAEFVAAKIKRTLSADENRAETTLGQLGMDSLDAMDVTLSVEQRFGFSSDAVPKSLGELWALAEGLHEKAPPRPAPPGWFDRPEGESKLSILGETVPEAFLNRAFASPKQVIVADDLAGGLTYEKLLVGAGAMAARFRDLPGANVGLMLPASVACDLAFLALHLAGKVPVVLNWTTGPANLGHAVKVAGLQRVVTSKAFVDRVQPQVPGAEFLYLEDLRAGVGTVEKLRRLLGVRWFGGLVRRRMLSGLSTDPNAPAVVLFTSGSEKAPKAVPLTHANIIADQRGCIDALNVTRDNSAIGFLPMFHSFGLTVTGLLPLFVGVRIVHHPDPTDAGALVRKIAAYKPTLLAGTPTFLGFILERAKPGDLDSLRIIIVGAEKCPPHVFEKTKALAPHAEVLEGYGITECAPVVSVNRPGRVRPGTIGEPLPNVEVLVTDIETKRPVPQGAMGMLHVAGPTVFPGYLGADAPDPFEEINGKKWYVTGDLAALDEAGAIVFHGRMKRFLKAGGEMISLPALEEPFAKKYPPTDAGPRVAVEGVETDHGRRIVLFATEDISLSDANALLQAEGLRGVMRLDAVKKLDALPVLGTGKTDYKVLRGMIEAK